MIPDDPANPRPPLERALGKRILALQRAGAAGETPGVEYDLTRPETPAPGFVVNQAVVAALEAGETHYTARTGIAPLREAIAGLSTSQGFPATAGTTVVTNGGSEALFIALQVLVSAGDQVVLVEPCAPHIETLAAFLGGIVRKAPALSNLDLKDAVAVVLPASSGIDGRIVADSDLAQTLEAAAASGVTVILDRSSVPDCYVQPAPFSRPELAENIVTLGSFSGAFGLAGWRAGYFTAPEGLIPRLAGLKESMSISTATPAQFAALAALEHAGPILDAARNRFVKRRGLVAGLLGEHGVSFVAPDVYPGLLIDARHVGADDTGLAQRLESGAGVRVEPASMYGASLAGFIRIDLRAPLDALEAGLPGIAAFLSEEAR